METTRGERSIVGPLIALCALALAACGARSGLVLPDDRDAGVPADAAEEDAPADVAHDATPDVVHDVAVEDALPPIDAAHEPDAGNPYCADAGATLVYVITDDEGLYSFYPPSAAFTRIGTIACPVQGNATPFSMAVDRDGTAYVVFNDGELFRVSTADASCQATSFVPGQAGFVTFGMGFVADADGPGETLYVAGEQGNPELGTIDTTSLVLASVAPLAVAGAELTGTGDGRLFAFYAANAQQSGAAVGELDRATGAVVAESLLPTVTQGSAWAFAYWGSEFWLFTAPSGGSSTVTRFRPADGSVTVVATLPSLIVGAGVSTCAPQ